MKTPINSLQNQRVKQAIKLRDRRGRERQGRIVIDGLREIRHAIEAGIEIVQVFVCRKLCDSEVARTLNECCEQNTAEWLEVSRPVWEKLAYGDRRDGVLVVARTPARSLDQIPLSANPLVIVLDAIEKPGNVGAVCRTADAVGADAVVVAESGTDLFNPNAIRASIGTIFCVPAVATERGAVIAWLRNVVSTIYVTRVDSVQHYRKADFRGACAIVLGSEALGLHASWSGNNIVPIRLPMRGVADSLNVSNTAAVLMYEALRQRELDCPAA